MAQSSQRFEPPQNPGRFSKAPDECEQVTKEFVALSAKQDAAMRQSCQDTANEACRGHIAAALEGSKTQMDLVVAGSLPTNYAAGADLNAQANRLARNVIMADIKAACLADATCRQKQDNINGVLMLGTIGLLTAPMLPSLGSAATAWIVANPVTALQLGIITAETAAALATGAVSPGSLAEGMFAVAAMGSIKFVGPAGAIKNIGGVSGGVFAVDAAVATGSPITTRFVNGVTVVDQRTGAVFNGTVDLQPTFDRIATGATGLSRNDGTVFRNLPDRTTGQILLPAKPPGYYTEYVVATPGINGAGPQRIVTGQSGEMFYTPDHYLTFIPIKKP